MDFTADIIKRLRAAGLSQSEIHRRTGIPQPRLSRWEAGKAPDSADDALKLAKLDAELQQGVTTPLALASASAPAPAPASTSALNIPAKDRRGTEPDRRQVQVPIGFPDQRGTKPDRRDGPQGTKQGE